MKIGDLVRRTNSTNGVCGVVVRTDVQECLVLVAWNLGRHYWDHSLLADLEVVGESR